MLDKSAYVFMKTKTFLELTNHLVLKMLDKSACVCMIYWKWFYFWERAVKLNFDEYFTKLTQSSGSNS